MSKRRTLPWQNAQGDLLLEDITGVPNGFRPVPPDEYGRNVLASGEATGHHHVVRTPGVCMLVREGTSDRIITTGNDIAQLLHDQGLDSYAPTLDHDPINIPANKTVRVIRQREWIGQGAQRVAD